VCSKVCLCDILDDSVLGEQRVQITLICALGIVSFLKSVVNSKLWASPEYQMVGALSDCPGSAVYMSNCLAHINWNS